MKFLNLSIYTGTFIMSIIYLMMAFMFLPSPEQARLQLLEFKCSNFYKAEQLAMEDFKKGDYTMALSGERYTSGKTELLDSILRADYNIIPVYTGCIGASLEVDHYMHTMLIQIANKYGYDFFDQARKKSLMIHKNRLAKKILFPELKAPPPIKN